MSSPVPSLEAKIVVLGSQGVGKTSLVHRYVKNMLPPRTASTVGASFLTKRVVDIDTGTVVRLQIWDTAGQERFRSISKLYYRGANAAILCYDMTDASSFTEMGRWLAELRENLAEDTILHVVGTKADVVAEDPARRQVPYERCIAYVAENLHPAHGTPLLGGSLVGGADVPARAPTPNADKMLSGGGGGGHGDARFGQHLGQALAAGGRGGGSSSRAPRPLPSPPSNRSSGLWGQDLAWTWTSCHEVSASTGEGVDEVFRVITRRLVEQRGQRAELEAAAATPGPGRGEAAYFDGRHKRGRYGGYGGGGGGGAGAGAGGGGGSFRVGYGDKRRSWMGLPTFGSLAQEEGVGGGGSREEQRQWESEIQGRRAARGGRCC